MVFIFPFTSDDNIDSLIELQDLENIVLAVEISFYARLQAKTEVFPVLEAAIFDFSFPVKSYNIPGTFII